MPAGGFDDEAVEAEHRHHPRHLVAVLGKERAEPGTGQNQGEDDRVKARGDYEPTPSQGPEVLLEGRRFHEPHRVSGRRGLTRAAEV
jgi:hypothetical protein